MDMNKKKSVLNAVRKYLKEKGYNHFKAYHIDTDNPTNIIEGITGEEFKPDLIARYKDALHVYKIESGENIERNKEKFIRKCKSLQQYAISKKGKLHLIVPIQHFEKILTEINKNNLENVGILQTDAL
jgi:hypothetical protein